MEKNIFAGALIAVMCSYGTFWQVCDLKHTESIDTPQALGSHEASLSSCTALTALFGAAALPESDGALPRLLPWLILCKRKWRKVGKKCVYFFLGQ